MRQIFTSLFFLLTLMTYAQNKEKSKYFYFNNNPISDKQYKELDRRKIFSNTIENDTAVIKNSFDNKKIDKLDSNQLLRLTTFLKDLFGTDFNAKKMTMIHLYGENNNAIYSDSKMKRYWKWIKTNSENYQSFLVATRNNQIKKDQSNNIYFDQDNFIENLFFKDSVFKINHLLLKPNGDVYIYYGIDDILYVLDSSFD